MVGWEENSWNGMVDGDGSGPVFFIFSLSNAHDWSMKFMNIIITITISNLPFIKINIKSYRFLFSLR